MIILDTTTRTLEVLLAATVATNQLPVTASFADVTTTTYTPISSNTVTNNATAVTVVAAPAASTQRQVKFLTVYNADTATAILTLRYNDNATTRIIAKVALAVGDTLLYTDEEGLRVMDSNGNIKQKSTAGIGGQATDTQPSNPTGTTSTSGLHMGLAVAFTPANTRIMILVTGWVTNNTGGDGAAMRIRYGTGTAPTNGAALTGTAAPQLLNTVAGTDKIPFALNVFATSLTAGVALWVDVELRAVTGGTASIGDINVAIIEV